MAKGIKILGIAGSVRKASFNKSALRAAQKLVPEGASIEVFDIDGLPSFNIGAMTWLFCHDHPNRVVPTR